MRLRLTRGLVLSTQLAIGTGKGSVLLYNHDDGSRTVVGARHKKKISCMAWSDGEASLLAFASDDKQVSGWAELGG